jgi:EmrB/QacA subfamily drug resistance transporter
MSSSSPLHGRWILAAATLTSSTAFLLNSAVNIALPSIQSYFGTNVAGIEWITNSHLLFLATLLLIGGSLGDYYGRKRVFLSGIAVFTIASISAGLASSIAFLIVLQAIQGIGAALMVPQSLAIINASFPENDRGRIIGLWAGISGAIAIMGPWLGGWLVEQFSWRAVFFINVPISLAAFILTAIFITEKQQIRFRHIDWMGTSLVFLSLLGIAYGLITGPADGWGKSTVLAGLVGGLVFAVIFVLSQIRFSNPLVPHQIFQNPLVFGANAVTILLYFALNGILFFLTLNLQQIQGFSPSAAGLGLLATFLVISLFSGPAGSLADRIGPRLQMILGPAIVASGAAYLGAFGNQSDYFTHYLPGLLLVGAGMSLVIAPLTKSALMVKTEFSGIASGVNNAMARYAALLAVAILGAVMLINFTAYLQSCLA